MLQFPGGSAVLRYTGGLREIWSSAVFGDLDASVLRGSAVLGGLEYCSTGVLPYQEGLKYREHQVLHYCRGPRDCRTGLWCATGLKGAFCRTVGAQALPC